MQRLNSTLIVRCLYVLSALLLPVFAAAQEMPHMEPVTSVTTVHRDGDDSPVENAESTLTRMEHGVYGIVKTTGLEPGDAYTVWWAIFNYPENCSNMDCSLDDVFQMDDHGNFVTGMRGGRTANREGRAAIGFSSLRAVGGIIDRDGTAEFRMHLPIGDVTESVEGPGLLDSMKAEIHFILRSHGKAIPGMMYDQLNSDWGGCPPQHPRTPCHEPQYAKHRVQH